MQYIRDHYKVPAKRGARIEYHDELGKFLYGFMYKPKRGTIVRSRGQYIRVRFDGETVVRTLHPTGVRYL